MKIGDIFKTFQKVAYRPMGGREKYWETSIFGCVDVCGDSKQESQDKALAWLHDTARNSEGPTYRWAGSVLFVLYFSHGAWGYDIVRPGSRAPSGCSLNVSSKQEALEKMEAHISQYEGV